MEPRGSLKIELLFAYLAAGAKVGAWVVVSALVFRDLGAADLGILALARSTVGLLAYAGAGLAPALVHRIAQAGRAASAVPVARPVEAGSPKPLVLSYASPGAIKPILPSHGPYSNGLVMVLCLGIVLLLGAAMYAAHFASLHGLHVGTHTARYQMERIVLFLAIGTLFRLISDVPAAVLQTSSWLWIDYAILAVGEILWAILCLDTSWRGRLDWNLLEITNAFMLSSVVVLLLRLGFGAYRQQLLFPRTSLVNPREMLTLLAFGVTVVFAQVADFLYAPTDYILINHFLGPDAVAAYAPAVQFDSALALVVTVLASVLLPRTALAHAAGDVHAVRRLYLRGTAVSVALLIPLAAALWAASGLIFRLWLGDDMPATRAILPLVLFHTILGGSSIVGRSVLLATGCIKAYALSVLIAGLANVALSWFFVARCGLGLYGIVLGTIIVIAGRSALWMPWYVLRTIRVSPVGPLEAGAQMAAQEYAP